MGYRVAKDKSVILAGRHLLEGAEIPGNLRALPELVASGYVVKTEAQDGSAEGYDKNAKEPPVLKPGSVVLDQGAPPPALLKPTPAIEVKIEEKKPAEMPIQPVGKWIVDPSTLKGKNLEQLNVMVLERDPSVKPFETIEEAVAQLSQDFKG